jgi:chromosome segregation ATPase
MFTTKQLNAVKKRRSTTLKKLDKLYEQAKDLEKKEESAREKWVECTSKISNMEWDAAKYKKLEAPCRKIMRSMNKLKKDTKKVYDRASKWETKVGELESKYGISANASY